MDKVFIIESYEEGWYANEKDIVAVFDNESLAQRIKDELEEKERKATESRGGKYGENGSMMFNLYEYNLLKEYSNRCFFCGLEINDDYWFLEYGRIHTKDCHDKWLEAAKN